MRRRHDPTQVFDGVPFFEGCDRRLLAEMAHQADRVRVTPGTVLAVAGRHAWQLVVLTEGTARSVEGGRTSTIVAGQAIAPDAVADISPFPATVTALSDVEVLVVNGPAFSWAAVRYPALARPVPAAVDRLPIHRSATHHQELVA